MQPGLSSTTVATPGILPAHPTTPETGADLMRVIVIDAAAI